MLTEKETNLLLALVGLVKRRLNLKEGEQTDLAAAQEAVRLEREQLVTLAEESVGYVDALQG